MFSKAFGVWISVFGACLQAVKALYISRTKLIGPSDTASAVFLPFWLVFPFRERNTFLRFS